MPAPQDLPESIVVGQFKGITNTVAPERLATDDLETAINVDIDNAGQLRLRRGTQRRASGNYHSLTNALGRTFVVKDGHLGTLSSDYQFAQLGEVGNRPLSYTEVNETLYFSSPVASGKILPNLTAAPWGAHGGDGVWVSPVALPTATLGAVSGQMLGPPPLASVIEGYSGRIYLAHERTIWATELFLYDYVDRTRTYIQIDGNVADMKSVDDGIWVGTDKGLMFLQGTLSGGLKYKQVNSSPIIPGSACRIEERDVRAALGESTREGQAVVMLSRDGVFACFAGGEARDLTNGRVLFPDAERAAVLFRQEAGVTSYVISADSAGGVRANVRIGDYAEAEIRRFQGG